MIKQYLVTESELKRFMKIGDTIDAAEVPPDARVLTRERVEIIFNNVFHDAQLKSLVLEELFGEEGE